MTPASLTLAALSALAGAVAAATLTVCGRGAGRDALKAEVARRTREAKRLVKVWRRKARDDLREEMASRAKGKVT